MALSLDRLHIPSNVCRIFPPWQWDTEVPSVPSLPTPFADAAPGKVAQGHRAHPFARTGLQGWPQDPCKSPTEREGVKAAPLLRDFSVICTHVMGIRAVGGSASLWQSFRPMAQHLTPSESPLIPAVFKFN